VLGRKNLIVKQDYFKLGTPTSQSHENAMGKFEKIFIYREVY